MFTLTVAVISFWLAGIINYHLEVTYFCVSTLKLYPYMLSYSYIVSLFFFVSFFFLFYLFWHCCFYRSLSSILFFVCFFYGVGCLFFVSSSLFSPSSPLNLTVVSGLLFNFLFSALIPQIIFFLNYHSVPSFCLTSSDGEFF